MMLAAGDNEKKLIKQIDTNGRYIPNDPGAISFVLLCVVCILHVLSPLHPSHIEHGGRLLPPLLPLL